MATEEEHEIWENASKGRVAIRKFDDRGRDKVELVTGGRKFSITTRERRHNQGLVALEELDVFTNGTLRPVRMIEGTEDAAELAGNPNHLSDSDMNDMLKLHYKKFDERLSEITNPGTLERLLERAQTDEANATVRTVKRIEERLRETNPVEIAETTHVGTTNDAMAGGIKPVTPR